MSLRKTSCSHCVRAKRRCDRAWPACRRCSRQSLECQYPYPRAAAFEPLPVTDDAPEGLSPRILLDQPVELTLGDGETDDVRRDVGGPRIQVPNGDFLGFEFENSTADWFAGFGDMSYLVQGDVAEDSVEDRTATPTSSPRSRRLKKQKVRSRQSLQGSDRDAGPVVASGTGNALSVYYLHPLDRSKEVDTWEFCANEMLSYISLFAETGTSPLMAPADLSRDDLHPALGKALGVCAAHETLRDTQRHIFDRLLDREMRDLVSSSTSPPSYDASGQGLGPETALRESTARLQAMTMYQIIWLFSDKVRDVDKSAQHEALFASWTRELQLRVQISQQQQQQQQASTSADGGAAVVGPDLPAGTGPDVLETAYRAIMLSYFVRCAHSFLSYGASAVLEELFRIFIPASLSGRGRRPLLYPDYVSEWERGLTPALGGNDGRLQYLLLVGCKGVGAVERQAILGA